MRSVGFDPIPKTLLRHWIDIAPGAFCAGDLSRDVDTQLLYINMLEEFVKDGILDHHGERRGWYIPKKLDLEPIDFKNVEAQPVDVWLPFEVSDIVELYENSIVIVSGAPNSGKTAILLNIILYNMNKDWDIYYFNSEMSAGELRKRLLNFSDIPIDHWNFNAYYRHERFNDVIFPGPNCLNIIDFLEVHDEFYVVGKRIKEIHDKLKGGIAIIALQKNPGQDTGLGGYRSMEVARLALAVDYGTVKISKAKNYRQPDKNPNGCKKDFKIFLGSQIIADRYWQKENPRKDL